jgi:hypothetical protein
VKYLTEPQDGPSGSQRKPPTSYVLPTNIGGDIVLKDGTVDIFYGNATEPTKVSLTKLNFNLSGPGLTEPWNLGASASVNTIYAGFQIAQAIKIGSQIQVDMANQVFKILKSTVNVGGIDMSAVGWMDWVNDKHHWTVTTNIPELKNLPVPPTLLPPGRWTV